MLHEAANDTDRHRGFLDHIQAALAQQACPTWLDLDSALKLASEACYPKHQGKELRPLREGPIQVALKHVWQARAALKANRNSVFLGLKFFRIGGELQH